MQTIWNRVLEFFGQTENFDIADVVNVLREHEDSRKALLSVLEFEGEQRMALIRTLVQRSEDQGAPRRLLVCLSMLKDPKLCDEVLEKLRT